MSNLELLDIDIKTRILAKDALNTITKKIDENMIWTYSGDKIA